MREMCALAGALGVVALAACGTSSATAPELLDPGKPGDAFAGAQCKSIRPPTEPDLMAWDSGSRLNLKAQREAGVVAVRYRVEGCNVELEILNCVGKGEYRFSPYSATETKVAKSARDLFAELPIGAAKLQGKLAGGRALRTDYMLAGLLLLPAMRSYDPSQLEGDCDQATHVVSKVYLGGFAMAAGESESLEAGVSLFGAGVGAGQNRTAERISQEGNAEACARAQSEGTQEALCSVPLRVGLVAITGRAEGGCGVAETWIENACVEAVEVGSLQERRLAEAQPRAAGSSPSAASAGMVRIPGGSFDMGSEDDDADNNPVHRVTVAAFELDLTEVTVAQYRACVEQRGCTSDHLSEYVDQKGIFYSSTSCNWSEAGRDEHPINCVDSNQANAYCRWAGKRLPSEEEWEYAARGSDGRAYPWGNAAPSNQLCWDGEGNDLGKGNRYGTCPVGAYRSGASPFGVLDLAGNVEEWTWSAPSDQLRYYRGGGWRRDEAASMRSERRAAIRSSDHDANSGFRCAR